MIPSLPDEYREAFAEKYFQSEGWEKSYIMRTSELRRISRYSGLSFTEILNLPYPLFYYSAEIVGLTVGCRIQMAENF